MLKDLGDGDFFSGPPGPHPCAESTTHRKNCKSWAKPTKRKEKEMKKMKKFFAMFLALAMVLGMSLTSFAEEPTPAKPVDTDKALVTISNVEAGSKYDAYQIIDAKYNTNGFVGYVWAKGMTDEDEVVTDAMTEVTSTMLTDLAKDPSALANKKLDFDPTKDELEVGTWMILVTPPTGDATKVYNPMLVSVYYSTDLTGDLNYPIAGSINANERWTILSTEAYMKSSTVTVEKSVDTLSNGQGEVGDTVTFTLTGVIPSYSAEYTSAVYKLTDTIVNGLEYTGNITVKVGTNESPTYTSTYANAVTNKATTFDVAFDSAYILGLANASEAERTVVITYTAEITADAITNVGKNEVSLEYTNRPGETTNATPDQAYTYTFSIDGVVQKVDGDGDALDGAEFTLYRTNTNGVLSDVVGSPVESAVTTGNIKFEGLDGKDTYYLKETKAPDGFSLNDTIYEIKFTNITPDGQGNVTYTVAVKNLTTGETKTSGVVNYGGLAAAYADQIVNVTISSLPSTGGIGTTIFTVGGCAIMIIAAGLYFSLRRKAAK